MVNELPRDTGVKDDELNTAEMENKMRGSLIKKRIPGMAAHVRCIAKNQQPDYQATRRRTDLDR
eukprot:2231974-Rhodomonas_salina.1